MAAVFGVLISGIQTIYLEQEALMEVEWTQPVVLFTIGYALRCGLLSAGCRGSGGLLVAVHAPCLRKSGAVGVCIDDGEFMCSLSWIEVGE